MSAVEESPSDVAAPPTDQKRNINFYYGHKVGLWQTTSLLLNAGLMVYAHVGLSGVIYSSFDPSSLLSGNAEGNNNIVSTCNEQDKETWENSGGESYLATKAEYCIGTFNGGCFTNSTCTELCLQEEGYSADCSICFGPLPQCGLDNGCTFLCLADSTGAACQDCLDPCIDILYSCSDLPEVKNATIDTEIIPNAVTGNTCNNFDLDAIDKWYAVYDLTFVDSVRDSWNNDAKVLSIIIVLFSGVWPYAKNILMLIIWYVPMTVESQKAGLLWLARLSKYTLVDVFAVIGVVVGVQLQLNLGGFAEAVIRAEPRFAILCFFLATVWEFIQIEVIKGMHERKVLVGEDIAKDEEETLLFSQTWIPILILLTTIGLYTGGASMEFISIANTNFGAVEPCITSYNMVQFGNAIVNKVSLTGNSVAGQTWFLYIVYVFLAFVLPILTHLMQIIFIAWRVRSKTLKKLIEWASVVWFFACIEVFVIGIFAMEFKFASFIKNIAGEGNEDFINIASSLGNGFYILVAYSVIACFLQFSLGVRSGGHAKSQQQEVDDGNRKESEDV